MTALALACLLPGVALEGTSGAASVGSSSATRKLLKAAIASAARQGSVRVTVHFVNGSVSGEVVQDSAGQTGVQTVAIGKERISVVLIGGIAYFSGNSQGLTSYFGLPASTATSLSGRWISIAPNQVGFKSVTSGMTLPAALREVTPAGSLALGKHSTQNRQATVSIQGSDSAIQTPTILFVATKGTKLPVEAVTAGKNGELGTGEIVTFSRWGEKLNLPKPTSTIPITALLALSSAQG